MDTPTLEAWFRLLEAPGLGRTRAHRLLEAFGDIHALWRAGRSAWTDAAGAATAQALLTAQARDLGARWQACLGWLDAHGNAAHVLVWDSPDYPAWLRQAPDAPLLLYVHGALRPLQRMSVAVVGSRRATAAGLDHARHFSRELSDAGWVVVSGLALGVDAAAHQGALDGPSPTVAVVGTGLDQTYPTRHKALAKRIVASGGALVSEFAIGTPPLAENFPQRNRIIAGLTRGTLVVEAVPQSGSLITARLALEANREVFAIPGSIDSPQSRGCHGLIRDGATLVETVDHILEVLGLPPDAPNPPRQPEAASAAPEADSDGPLLQALGYEPASLDVLEARTGLDIPTLSARLLELELTGQVARLPGGWYQRRGQA